MTLLTDFPHSPFAMMPLGFRTRQNRELELTTSAHRYDKPGRYAVAVKVIYVFGHGTMMLVSTHVGDWTA